MEYQLILRISITASDDPSARVKAKEAIKNMNVTEKTKIKLQRLKENSEPEGIPI